MRLRYAGTCGVCGTELAARTAAIYERSTRAVRCLECDAPPEVPVETDSGVAGASARREYERRRAKREGRIRSAYPRLGRLILALSNDPQSTRAWERGAVGEERVGARLDGLVSSGVAVLHDRRIPGTRANIDHLVVTTGGVWVVDPKRYRGRPELRVEGGVLRPRVEKLVVGGRDRTKLVDGVLRQVTLVQDVVGADVPVTGVLCFVEADWPMVGGSFTTRGVQVLWPRWLIKVLRESTGEVEVSGVQRLLASRFPPA